jgi:hypothetical protein
MKKLRGNFYWGVWRKLWDWQPLYWLRCHTFTRYHIIDIRGQDGYTWGWIDRSHAMYLACFKILMEFVEGEDPGIGLRSEQEYRGDLGDEEWAQHRPCILEQLERDNEIRALYDWWKTGRKQEQDACTKLLDGYDFRLRNAFKPVPDSDLLEYIPPAKDPRWEAWKVEHDRLEAKDEEMLARLMKVRQALWT